MKSLRRALDLVNASKLQVELASHAFAVKKSVAHLLMQLNQLSSEKTKRHMDDTDGVELLFVEFKPAEPKKPDPLQPIQKRKREPSLVELIARAERTSAIKILNEDTLSKRQRMHGWWRYD